MIKIIVATPKGELLNKDVESIVISGDTGQLGVLANRIPLLTKITKGFVKVNDTNVIYVGIVNGVVDFKDNVATVIAQNAAIAESAEEAHQAIEENLNAIIKANKQKNVDFVEAEKELIKNIKEMKAAHID
jgi:F-type H+-transporting ATPase subunit epsilon